MAKDQKQKVQLFSHPAELATEFTGQGNIMMDEPCLVIRAMDVSAAETVQLYADRVARNSPTGTSVQEIRDLAEKMKDWRDEYMASSARDRVNRARADARVRKAATEQDEEAKEASAQDEARRQSDQSKAAAPSGSTL